MRVVNKGIVAVIVLSIFCFYSFYNVDRNGILSHKVDLKNQDLKLYWKDNSGAVFKNFDKLNFWLESKNEQLIFAMNAGMYKTNNAPLGLYIEDGKMLSKVIDDLRAKWNKSLKLNGKKIADNWKPCPAETISPIFR